MAQDNDAQEGSSNRQRLQPSPASTEPSSPRSDSFPSSENTSWSTTPESLRDISGNGHEESCTERNIPQHASRIPVPIRRTTSSETSSNSGGSQNRGPNTSRTPSNDNPRVAARVNKGKAPQNRPKEAGLDAASRRLSQEIQNERNEHRRTVERLENEIKALQRKVGLKGTNTGLGNRTASLQVKVTGLKKTNETLRREQAALQGEVTRLQNENVRLRPRTNGLQESIARLKDEKKAQQEEVARLTLTNHEVQVDRDALQRQVTDLQGDIEALRDQVSTLQETNTGLQNANVRLQGEVNDLQESNVRQEAEQGAQQERFTRLQNENARLQGQVTDLEQTNHQHEELRQEQEQQYQQSQDRLRDQEQMTSQLISQWHALRELLGATLGEGDIVAQEHDDFEDMNARTLEAIRQIMDRNAALEDARLRDRARIADLEKRLRARVRARARERQSNMADNSFALIRYQRRGSAVHVVMRRPGEEYRVTKASRRALENPNTRSGRAFRSMRTTMT